MNCGPTKPNARNELNELTSINNRLQNQIYKAEKDSEILTDPGTGFGAGKPAQYGRCQREGRRTIAL
jgi:hypothetical protein